MAETRDTIVSHIPNHIVEDYPKFVEFLQGYYEWVAQEGQAYERIKHHNDYMAFEKSLDDYVNFLKMEYLTNIPLDAFGDQEIFIKWSRKLNRARGSHASYKFLFKMLFNEQTTEIYLPKEDILRGSDGVWIAGQNVMLTTNRVGDPARLLYKRIKQKRTIYGDIAEYAYATIDSYQIRNSNGFNLIEYRLIDVDGTFKPDYKIEDDEGNWEWPIETISSIEITNAGTEYTTGTKLNIDGWDNTYTKTLTATEAGKVDTRITTLLRKDDLSVTVDGSPLASGDFSYDGQYITAQSIDVDSEVVFEITNGYDGYFVISHIDDQGVVQTIDVLDSPIGTQEDLSLTTDSQFGSGLVATAKTGLVRKVPGYFRDESGFLSSSNYLLDSNYYQEYSYVIKTEQNIQKYADIVKGVLHPAGFKMFGSVRIINILDAIIGLDDAEGHGGIVPPPRYNIARYTLGPNYSFYDKSGGGLTVRGYDGDEWDTDFINGDAGYNLEDKSLERTYDYDGNPVVVTKKGWMSKDNMVDFDVVQPQDYVEHDNYKYMYLESSYVLTNDMDEAAFISKYIDIYSAYNYTEEGYSD